MTLRALEVAIRGAGEAVDREEWVKACQEEEDLGKKKADQARTRLQKAKLVQSEEKKEKGKSGRPKQLFKLIWPSSS